MNRIIDAHFHVWKRTDLAWLDGPMVPRIFGPYEPIRRDYLIEEYRADIAGAGVAKSVYVQTNWPVDRFEDEAAWVQHIADHAGWPHALVAYADMASADVRPQLDRLARHSLLRGVRMQLHWHERPEFRFAPSAEQVIAPSVRANVARLKDYGLSFDLQLFPSQMRAGAALVAENPDTAFVLTHAGMLTDRDRPTVDAWQDGMRALAAYPNLYVKLSGLGTFCHRNDPALIAFVIDTLLPMFGPERLMFGSNFPVEKIWTDHDTLIAAYRRAIDPHGTAVADDIFGKTAERVYRPS